MPITISTTGDFQNVGAQFLPVASLAYTLVMVSEWFPNGFLLRFLKIFFTSEQPSFRLRDFFIPTPNNSNTALVRMLGVKNEPLVLRNMFSLSSPACATKSSQKT